MNDVKNSDVFNLPVNVITVRYDDFIKSEYRDCMTPWDCIDRSINEYDELKAENKKLREQLANAMDYIDSIRSENFKCIELYKNDNKGKI